MIACPCCGELTHTAAGMDRHRAQHDRWREPMPSPYVQAERLLTGQRWTDGEADSLIALIRIGAAKGPLHRPE